ncbi:MAG: two-component sensor histidine kinase [Cytophagaceae bacterium]|jgi:signal transduction histidine kinase|nr:two-component sensor histidine kinase [Cytophagaceae bacterium]
MKIRYRLALLFSVIVASIVLIFSFITYVLYADYRNDEFYKRLKHKAQTTARLLADVKEVDKDLLRIIDQNTINELYKEKVIIYDKDNDLIYSSIDDEVISIDKQLLDKVRTNKYIEYVEKENEVIGLFYRENGANYVVFVSAFDKYGKRKMENLMYFLSLSSLISILITVAAGIFFSGRAIDPIIEINKQVSILTVDNLSSRVKTHGSRDEIDQLAQNFNQMLDRIEHSIKVQKSFINNASHELRTPLAVINSQLDVALSKNRENVDYVIILQSLQEDARKMTNLVNTMLVLAKSEEQQHTILNDFIRLDELILSVQDELISLYPNYTVDFSYVSMPESDSYMTVKGNELLLRSAFMNLMENACKFSNSHLVKVRINSDHDNLVVHIYDNGIGIPEEDVSRIFDPFYRADNGRQIRGFGIGLSICKRAIDLHDGKISVKSQLNAGSTFTLVFKHV